MRNKNSDIRVSSDLHLLAPAAVQILYLIQIKNNELSWDTFFPQGCPMEENEILFEPNKNHNTSWRFSDHEMSHREGRNFIWLK